LHSRFLRTNYSCHCGSKDVCCSWGGEDLLDESRAQGFSESTETVFALCGKPLAPDPCESRGVTLSPNQFVLVNGTQI
jgi:hypothetical protein